MLSLEVIERAADKVPPVLQFPVEAKQSPLRRFIALQYDSILILGPRHIPALPCPASNTHYAMSVVTSIGFSMLESTDYAEAVQKLKPDIAFSMADVVDSRPGAKRKEKMGDRTQSWLKDIISAVEDDNDDVTRTAVFAPILPIEAEEQTYYLEALNDEFAGSISGLVLYETASVLSIPSGLSCLPRMLTADLRNPHKLLEAVAVGLDIFVVPFIGAATDAGIALDCFFPVQKPEGSNAPLQLGIDMWSNTHAVDTSPLQHGCDCYTCTNHHRAYLQHLLSAKEMLGWVLLQIHNHRIMDYFFAGIRSCISDGSFDEQRRAFGESYEPELPEKTGQGPRYA